MSLDLELAADETVYRVLSEDGSELVAEPPDLPDDDLVAVMAEMVKARVANGRFFSLQRQGRAGTYAPIEGQEAVVVGAVAALDPARDWVLPQYREPVALGRYGPEVLRTYALYQRGHPAGGHFPAPIRVFPVQISLAAQIPHALGLAWAMQLKGEAGVACVFFGDGASSEGDFYEAGNFAGVLRAPVLFLCVNNGWAISTPLHSQTAAVSFAAKAAAFGFPGVRVDGNDALAMISVVAAARERAVTGGGPTLIEAVTFRMGPHTTADDPKRYQPPEERAGWEGRDPILRLRRHLEGRGLWGDDRQAAAETAAAAEIDAAWDAAEATTVAPDHFFDHVYAEPTPRMETQRAELRARLGLDPQIGGLSDVAVMTLVESINHTLHEEMERDGRVLVFGQDVARNGGVFRATDGLLDRFGGARVVDTPLSEGVIIGTAVGLAAEGFVPVPEIQFLGFSWQAFHQIAGQLARLRYRSDGRFDCPVTVRAPFGGGVRTPELHSEALEAQLVQCPGLKVVLPASAADAKGLLASAIRDPDPVMFLEPLKGYRLVKDDVPEGEHLVPLGKANVVRTGDDVVLIAWSAQVEVARKAATVLAADHGVSAGVLDLRTLVPLDIAAIVAAVEHTGRAVVVSEAPQSAGFAAEVVATICEEAFYSLEAPVARVTGYDVPYPVGMLEEHYVPDAARVVAAALRVCGEGA